MIETKQDYSSMVETHKEESCVGISSNKSFGDFSSLELQPTRLYTRRWLILTLQFLLCLSVNLTQYNFTPIANIVEEWYGINDTLLMMLVAVFIIAGFSVRFLAMYIIDRPQGLRIGVSTQKTKIKKRLEISDKKNYFCTIKMIISALFNGVGNLLRAFPGSERYGYVAMLIGQTLCAVALSFVDIAAPKLAQNWFSSKERTTATAIGSSPILLSMLLGYILTPAVVKHGSDLRLFMLAQTVAAVAIGILVWFFFKSAPPAPPSASSCRKKIAFFTSFKQVFTDKNFIVLFLLFCLGGGGAVVYSIILPQLVVPEGYSNVNEHEIFTLEISKKICPPKISLKEVSLGPFGLSES